MQGKEITAVTVSKVAMSFVTDTPFKQDILQRKLGVHNGKFLSPYWVSVKTLKRLKIEVKPSQRNSGVFVDMGDVSYNVKRMPSRFTLQKRISNAQLVRMRSRSDFRLWYNIAQTKSLEKLQKLVGKSVAYDGVDGQKISDKRIQQGLTSVASQYTSCHWISQDDARKLSLTTKEDIQPIAISCTKDIEKPSGSSMLQRMQAGGLYLPSLVQNNIQTTLFYNLDHFVDQKMVHEIRKLYPYKVFMGRKDFYLRVFSMELLAFALEKNYTSPLWSAQTKIKKREFTILKDEYFQLMGDEGTRFYNHSVLDGDFYWEEVSRFKDHFSLFHRIKLPEAFYTKLHNSVKRCDFHSNFWVSEAEVQELGLRLLPKQKPTIVRTSTSQTTAHALYNIEQTLPLKSC